MRMSALEDDPLALKGLMLIGRSVKAARRAHLLSQRKLADWAQIDQSAVSRLENGLARGMKLKSIGRIVAIMPDVLNPAARQGDADR